VAEVDIRLSIAQLQAIVGVLEAKRADDEWKLPLETDMGFGIHTVPSVPIPNHVTLARGFLHNREHGLNSTADPCPFGAAAVENILVDFGAVEQSESAPALTPEQEAMKTVLTKAADQWKRTNVKVEVNLGSQSSPDWQPLTISKVNREHGKVVGYFTVPHNATVSFEVSPAGFKIDGAAARSLGGSGVGYNVQPL
jgi:hypothetical protein